MLATDIEVVARTHTQTGLRHTHTLSVPLADRRAALLCSEQRTTAEHRNPPCRDYIQRAGDREEVEKG